LNDFTSNSGTAKNNGIFGKGRPGRSGEGIIEGVIVGGSLGEWERMEEDVVFVGGGDPWANGGGWWLSAEESLGEWWSSAVESSGEWERKVWTAVGSFERMEEDGDRRRRNPWVNAGKGWSSAVESSGEWQRKPWSAVGSFERMGEGEDGDPSAAKFLGELESGCGQTTNRQDLSDTISNRVLL